MKQRTTDPELLRKHEEAWKALKALPLDQEIELLFERLRELETWNTECESLEEHAARYEAGKPRDIRARINQLQEQLYQTPENLRWFELYQKLYP